MLDQLVSQHGCVIKSSQLRKLPHIARCKKHLLSIDGNPRCIAVIEIAIKETTFYILEVDTSDAINSLSTMILLFNSPSDWKKQLGELERMLVKRSLTWPNHLFDKYCGSEGFRGISHPKSSVSDKGLLDSDSVVHWADRFHRLMKAMVK